MVPDNNFAVNGGVEDGTTSWAARGDAAIERTTAEAYEGEASLLVSNRAASWHGATFGVGYLTPGYDYEVAVWVKLAAGESPAMIKLTGKTVGAGDADVYTDVSVAEATADDWTLLQGNYIPEDDFDYFIIETLEAGASASFYADNMSVAGEREEPPVVMPPPGNSGEGLASYADFPVGVAVNLEGGNRDTFNSQGRTQIVLNNFDQVSVENNMKMSYWNESNHANAKVDTLANWARDNGMTIHGHTLVWHPCYQLPSWAGSSNNYEQNFANHITGVASQHTDVIVSWDVVNEALQDGNDDGSYSGCRYETGGAVVDGANYRKSAHYLGWGGPGYIAEAFRVADAAAPNADLYYNDFNTENGQEKTDSLVALVTGLVRDGVPIDGVGFQMHVLPTWPSIATIKESWNRVLAIDPSLKIKLTEVDVRINNYYDGDTSNDYASCGEGCAGRDGQKQRYYDIVKAYYEVVPPARRGGITIWGISDPDSWFANTNDGPDWPLLWDGALNPKPAYEGVEEALREGGAN